MQRNANYTHVYNSPFNNGFIKKQKEEKNKQMPVLKITQADIMKTKNLEPGWYGVQIVKVHPLRQAKSGTSINQKITFLVEGSNGKEIEETFNTALIGKIAPLWESCLGEKLGEGEFDTDRLLNKKCDGKVVSQEYEGNLYDHIQLYVPYGKSKEVAPF